MIYIEWIDIPFYSEPKNKKDKNFVRELLRTEHVPIYNINDFPYDKARERAGTCSNGKGLTYINVPCAFDIEATTVEDTSFVDDEKHYIGFMYVWQFCYDDMVVMGRYWEEFLEFLMKLEDTLFLNQKRRLVIYIHYLAYEFQFIRNFVTITDMFARKKRVPMKFTFNDCFECRCSYFLSNMSLARFIKYTPQAKFQKQSGADFDYHVMRLPNTPLTELEKGYCYCDVRGLCEALAYLMIEHNLANIPLTSTGFLRNEVREAVFTNPKNKKVVDALQLNKETYILCKTASRGGNTHANAIYSNKILENMKSKDRKSSYPAEMVVGNYPVTPFKRGIPTKENLLSLVNEYACLLDITLYNVHLKKVQIMPYIPISKCTHYYKNTKTEKHVILDNGRVTHADEISLVCTDVDFNIILSQYFIGDIEVRDIRISEYGKLNNEFRNKLMDFFEAKCKLEGGDKYLYDKFKNKVNAFFGMMLTDIANPEILYLNQIDKVWDKSPLDLDSMLANHYKKRNTFLSYQHGIWVTANARKQLQIALDAVNEDGVYCDTDSVKYLGNHDADFERVNNDWLELCEKNDMKPYVDVNGKRIFLGKWEDDGEYAYFKTLGAKKYAYIDMEGEMHITVAGLSKDKGAEYLEKVGGIKAFAIGTTVPKSMSGRTVAYYNDTTEVKQLTIDGCTFSVGSNVAVVDATYTFGISDDYDEYLVGIGNSPGELDLKEIIYHEEYFITDN